MPKSRPRRRFSAGAFWAHRFSDALGLPAYPLGMVLTPHREPAGLSGTVFADGRPADARVTVRPMPARLRVRWLAAHGLGPAAACPLPSDPQTALLADSQSLSPIPDLGEIDATCTCAHAGAASGRCRHIETLLVVLAQQIASDPSRLWHLRGLDRPIDPATDGAASVTRLLARRTVKDRARVRFAARPAATRARSARLAGTHLSDFVAPVPAVAPAHPPELSAAWSEAPRALSRLGPLPYARGQADAVKPVMDLWRDVRDVAERLLRAPARRVASGARSRRRT